MRKLQFVLVAAFASALTALAAVMTTSNAAPTVVPENTEGLVTIKLQPTRFLRLVRSGSMVMFIRARKEGDNVLAGISSRRLVRVRTAAPQS